MERIDIDFDGRIENVPIYNVDDFPYPSPSLYQLDAKSGEIMYLNVAVSFDIEATTICVKQPTEKEKGVYTGFMYLWQFCLNDTVIMGRTWEDFQKFLDKLIQALHLSYKRRLVVYVHNLAYEFQFMRNFIDVDEMFARKPRKPMKFLANGCIEFRCSYYLSNMSLEKFVSSTPNVRFFKRSGDAFNYSLLRLPNTQLSNFELGYAYCDVRGLCEAISYKMQEYGLAHIPLTSTGYVRTDARTAILSNPLNKDDVNRLKLSPTTYVLCKTASRGGNVHANPDIAGQIISNVKSKDRKSSYPAEMVVDFYPVTPFRRVEPSERVLFEVIHEKACLIDCTLYGLTLKKDAVMPYLPKAKCTKVVKGIFDNGRIAYADEASFVCTDVDLKIILSQYTYIDIYIDTLQIAQYGRLPVEFRQLIMDYFYEKTKLEDGDKYLYAKFKNKINAFFGMMLTDIANPEIIYAPNAEKIWSKGDINLEQMLLQHYSKRSTFQSYQHGIWVTANARKRLQDALDCVGRDDAHYCDTDSVKYTGDHEKDFERVNEQWLVDCENCDIKPYVTVNGKTTHLGKWEDDGEYSKFVTLGAKKYAYISTDEPDEIHITVAGLNKIKGANYLKTHGGLEAFKVGTTVPAGDAGRTTAYYNDIDEPYTLTVNNFSFTTASNIAIVETSYTFGISDEYAEYLLNIQGEEIYENYFEIYTELDSSGHI